jgi:Arc/MetJ-type ribon-helix-helix transcriptional regulator
MHLITVHLPEAYLEGLDSLVDEHIYPNRSEAIRVAVRDLLKTELTMFMKNPEGAQKIELAPVED